MEIFNQVIVKMLGSIGIVGINAMQFIFISFSWLLN
jgi:hypothetical protein